MFRVPYLWIKLESSQIWLPTVLYVREPLPPVYESVDEKDERLTINVNVSYATVAEREDGLSDIYDDVNMRQWLNFNVEIMYYNFPSKANYMISANC